jgi:hypothetical protein
MRTLTALLLVLALTVAPVARAGDDPAVAHLAIFLDEFGHQSGLPQDAAAERISPHLSAALNAALDAARAHQKKFVAEFPDEKPPWIEGPLFNSSGYEPYTGYAIVAPDGGCRGERCTLRVDYSDSSVTPAITWHDEYAMVLEGGQWRLDDVRFRAGFAYGNHGNLRANLAVDDHED